MLAEVQHNDDVNDKILSELRAAEVVVAEFTGQRGGVYFEAGFARALGREVIWCCRKDEETKLHFDTRQFNFVFWENPEDRKQKLIDRVRGTGFARKLE
jgi:nucleoside 2-deoxyribosyltransferase